MIRAIIYMKDGTVDYVDPIHDKTKDVIYTDDGVTINNGMYDYFYSKNLYANVEIVEIDDARDRMLKQIVDDNIGAWKELADE